MNITVFTKAENNNVRSQKFFIFNYVRLPLSKMYLLESILNWDRVVVGFFLKTFNLFFSLRNFKLRADMI